MLRVLLPKLNYSSLFTHRPMHTMGTGIEQPRHEADSSSPSGAKIKEKYTSVVLNKFTFNYAYLFMHTGCLVSPFTKIFSDMIYWQFSTLF
jgi:hypothetical protein